MKTVLWTAGILIIIYLLMIMPSFRSKKIMKPLRGVLYAHRGLYQNDSSAPENSLAAFSRAVESGYGIEFDVQLTKDRVPVVFHDFTCQRMLRDQKGNPVKGRIKDYTYEELMRFHLLESDQKVPSFNEFLDLVDGKVPLIVELKVEGDENHQDLCALVDYRLDSYRGIYCVESFDPRVVIWYRRHHREIARGQLGDMYTKGPHPMRGIRFVLAEYLCSNFLSRPDFVAYNWEYASNISRVLCHKLFGNVAVAYTIQSQQCLNEQKKNFDVMIFDIFIPENGPKG